MRRKSPFRAAAGMLAAAFLLLAAPLCAAVPVRIAVHPPCVRIGETARVDLTWTGRAPEDAAVECTATDGTLRAEGGGWLFTPPDRAGRLFVRLVVRDGDRVLAESAAPVLVCRRIIILKADDFCAAPPECAARWKQYVNEVVLRRGVKTSLGVIGEQVAGAPAAFRQWVRTWLTGGLVELFNHGYDHAYTLPDNPFSRMVWNGMAAGGARGRQGYPPGTVYEFQGTPHGRQRAHIARTQRVVRALFGVQMRSFGAPFNKWDSATARALSAPGQNIDVWFSGADGSGAFIIPRGGGEIEGPDGVPSVEYFLKSLDPGQKAVLLQHHPAQETFMKGWDQFLAILDRLADDGVVFMLPGEYADLCRDGTLPLEPRALIPDPALECAARMALDRWSGPLTKAELAGLRAKGMVESTVRSASGKTARHATTVEAAPQPGAK